MAKKGKAGGGSIGWLPRLVFDRSLQPKTTTTTKTLTRPTTLTRMITATLTSVYTATRIIEHSYTTTQVAPTTLMIMKPLLLVDHKAYICFYIRNRDRSRSTIDHAQSALRMSWGSRLPLPFPRELWRQLSRLRGASDRYSPSSAHVLPWKP